MLLTFLLEVEISGVAAAAFNEDFLSENDFKVVLAILCCYDYGANSSGAVKRIASDEKDYHKCFFCVIVCCLATAYHQQQ